MTFPWPRYRIRDLMIVMLVVAIFAAAYSAQQLRRQEEAASAAKLSQSRQEIHDRLSVRKLGVLFEQESTRILNLDWGLQKITTSNLEALNGLWIEELILDGTAITDKDVQLLRNVRGLRELSVAKTPITDKACETIELLDELEVLNISYTPITNDGMLRLSTLPRLRELDIRGTRMSAEGIARFKRSNPTCKIIGDGDDPPQ